MTKKEIRKTFDDEEPCLVKSHDIHVDADYAEWIAEVKHRYRSSQVKAALKVNAEKLLFNWQLGRDLVQKKAEERWGAGVVEQVSLDLRREFPEEDGFSARNLRYMKQWYLYYTTETGKLQRSVAEIMIQAGVELNIAKLQRPVAEMNETWMSSDIETFPFPFAFVPWGQHIEIMTRSQSLQEALFYIQQVIEKGLSRPALINCFKAHLYEHQGKIVNNFIEYLPDSRSELVQ